MREVASFEDEQTARRFADVLCSRDIETDVSQAKSGRFTVWVLDERQMDGARSAWAAFDGAPDAPEHRAAEGCVERKLRRVHREEGRSRHEVIPVRQRFTGTPSGSVGVTVFLVVTSVAVTLGTQSSKAEALLEWLLIGRVGEALFESVLRGQIWRLVTPIFVHFGFLHILFNGWWVADLGAAIERRIGSPKLLGLVIVTGALSNALQYIVSGSPYFGGLSGVVYALLGYVWVRGRRDPTFGLALTQQTVVILLVWLALGFAGVLGAVANFAHLGGLVVGGLLGLL